MVLAVVAAAVDVVALWRPTRARLRATPLNSLVKPLPVVAVARLAALPAEPLRLGDLQRAEQLELAAEPLPVR